MNCGLRGGKLGGEWHKSGWGKKQWLVMSGEWLETATKTLEFAQEFFIARGIRAAGSSATVELLKCGFSDRAAAGAERESV